MTAHDVAQSLKDRAARAGFDAVGLAAAGRLDRDAEALSAWLRAGRGSGMEWIARSAGPRVDPRDLVPGCRSVVSLAVSYWPGAKAASTPDGSARVALYAQARDYHRTVGAAARSLAAWLEETTGTAARAFVDSGPVLERAWAERSGIGWIGKNSVVISRELGSWLLLAEILTAAAIEPDEGPHADFCGTCTACLDACPTSALVAPRVLDAARCISYWTIERRGSVPRGRREGNGEWIFGCDVCQDVCPWNRRFARTAPGPLVEPRPDLRGLDPVEVLSMTEWDFRERWSGTPLLRAKWEGMRRNACIVLGNRREAASVPALERALADADTVVRGHAAWALGRSGTEPARRALDDALAGEQDAGVREEIAEALAGLRA